MKHLTTWLFLIALMVPAGASASGRLDRAGVIGFGGGAGWGIVFGNSRYALEYDNGVNYHLNLKYMVSPQWAIAAYFANQELSAVTNAQLPSLIPPGGVPYERAVVTSFEGHALYYFQRESSASQYFTFGLGVYRPELQAGEIQTFFPPSGLTVHVGLGVELFLHERWALDVSARATNWFGSGYAFQDETNASPEDLEKLNSSGTLSTVGQIQAGILFYILQ